MGSKKNIKPIKNLSDLDKHQMRVRKECKRMEKEIFQNVLHPQTLIFNSIGKFAGNIMGGNKHDTSNTATSGFGSILHNSGLKTIAQFLLTNVILKRFIKRGFRSWAKWQIFNIGLILVRKLLRRKK